MGSICLKPVCSRVLSSKGAFEQCDTSQSWTNHKYGFKSLTQPHCTQAILARMLNGPRQKQDIDMWDCIMYTRGWVGVIIGGSYHQYWHSMPVECGLSISPQTLPYLPRIQTDTHTMAQMSNCFWLAIQCCNNIKWFNVTPQGGCCRQ